jgi:hypothetical protein
VCCASLGYRGGTCTFSNCACPGTICHGTSTTAAGYSDSFAYFGTQSANWFANTKTVMEHPMSTGIRDASDLRRSHGTDC